MIRGGLVSVTFRALPPREVAGLAARAGLAGIEWGGDIHVPHGDGKRAREVRRITEDAGAGGRGVRFLLSCRLQSFRGAGLWTSAGIRGGAARARDTGLGRRPGFVGCRRRLAGDRRGGRPAHRRAGGRGGDCGGFRVPRRHADRHRRFRPPTDAGGRAGRGWAAAGSRRSAWTMRSGSRDCGGSCRGWETSMYSIGLRRAIPLPLRPTADRWAESVDAWRQYLKAIRDARGDRYALLEFVRADDPEQFLRDAAVLNRLLVYSIS